MLVIDAFLTLITWLPYNVYEIIADGLGGDIFDSYTTEQLDVMSRTLVVIVITNMFSTPIVYFTFNRHFRVSGVKYATL